MEAPGGGIGGGLGGEPTAGMGNGRRSREVGADGCRGFFYFRFGPTRRGAVRWDGGGGGVLNRSARTPLSLEGGRGRSFQSRVVT